MFGKILFITIYDLKRTVFNDFETISINDGEHQFSKILVCNGKLSVLSLATNIASWTFGSYKLYVPHFEKVIDRQPILHNYSLSFRQTICCPIVQTNYMLSYVKKQKQFTLNL